MKNRSLIGVAVTALFDKNIKLNRQNPKTKYMKQFAFVFLIILTLGQLKGQVIGTLQTAENNLTIFEDRGYSRIKLSYPLPTKTYITTHGIIGAPEVP